jgi:hypothetical protein
MPKGVTLHRLHRSPDELDGLLRAYFRSEMPDPWPQAPGATPPRRVVTPPWQSWRRHLALAAAVSFFLLGSFLLTQGFPQVTPEDGGPRLTTPGSVIGKGQPRSKLIDRNKTLDELPAYQDEKPPVKLQPMNEVLPLYTTPQQDNIFGARRDGVIIMGAVKGKKLP